MAGFLFRFSHHVFLICRSGVGFSESRLPAVHPVLRSAQESGLTHIPHQITGPGRVEVGHLVLHVIGTSDRGHSK